MDVHPTKNVFIGIDPYPYIYIYYNYLLLLNIVDEPWITCQANRLLGKIFELTHQLIPEHQVNPVIESDFAVRPHNEYCRIYSDI
jgi:hypothetical protein